MAVVRHDTAQHPIDRGLIGSKRRDEIGLVLVAFGEGDPTDTFGELLERRAARQHRRHEPRVRTRGFSRADTREKPGAHDARLAAPRSTNDDDESSAEIVVTQTFDQFVDDALASEEVGCVGFVEGTQTLVRIHRLGTGAISAPTCRRDRRDDRADRRAIAGEKVTQRCRNLVE